jgi:hypothetical protein
VEAVAILDEILPALPATREEELTPPRLGLDLVGLAEAAELIGIARAPLSDRRRCDPGFPPPVAESRCGPIWFRAQIEHYQIGQRRLVYRSILPRSAR